MALNQVGLERLNTATTKKIGTNKNLIINGAMLVAHREVRHLLLLVIKP